VSAIAKPEKHGLRAIPLPMCVPGAEIFRHYLNEWLELKAADGFRAAQIDYWMNGKPRSDRPPRWNLFDALAGVMRH
jgi:hypothetical protein